MNSNVIPRYLLLLPLLGGCLFSGEQVEPAVSFDGHVWQVVAEGATASIGNSTFYILDNSNKPIRGAECYCPPEHILFLSVQQGLGDGGDIYDFLLGELRHKAIDNCKYVAYNLMGADADTDTCTSAVANYNDGAPFNTEEACTQWNYNCPPLSEIDPEGEDEVWDDDPDAGAETDTESNLTPLDELGLHVSCSMGTCLISVELYEFVLEYPEMLDTNGGVLQEYRPAGPLDGLQFVDVPTGCLAAHLGFEVDDVVTKVNNYSISSYANWPTILGTLANASTATVTYERDSTEHTLTVTVDE
jgi:hypothetical protein